MGGLWEFLTGWAGFASLTLHPNLLMVLFAAAGFTLVRVANHRSRDTDFRWNPRDLFQWAEMGFFFLLLLAGLAGRVLR